MIKQIMQINITWLKIQTGVRQTSWLFTSMTEKLNSGLSRNNCSLVVSAGLEPATSGFQVQRPNHSATMPPLIPFSAVQYCMMLHMFTCISDHVTAFSKGVLSVILPIQYNRRLHRFSQIILNTVPLKNTRKKTALHLRWLPIVLPLHTR